MATKVPALNSLFYNLFYEASLEPIASPRLVVPSQGTCTIRSGPVPPSSRTPAFTELRAGRPDNTISHVAVNKMYGKYQRRIATKHLLLGAERPATMAGNSMRPSFVSPLASRTEQSCVTSGSPWQIVTLRASF